MIVKPLGLTILSEKALIVLTVVGIKRCWSQDSCSQDEKGHWSLRFPSEKSPEAQRGNRWPGPWGRGQHLQVVELAVLL